MSLNPFSDVYVQQMVRELQRAHSLHENQKYDEARDTLRTVLADARRRGIASPHLHWSIAVTADHLGELSLAVENIREALRLDPLAPSFHRSLGIIKNRLEATIAEVDLNDAEVPFVEMYEGLKSLGAIDPAIHVIAARYHLAHGRTERAAELARAVLLLGECAPAEALLRELEGRSEVELPLTPPN